MLYLTRKVGESIIIDDNIEVTVVEVRGRSIKLGFTFPPHVSVLRREIFERIQEENRAAAASSYDMRQPLADELRTRLNPSRLNHAGDQRRSTDATAPTAAAKPQRT